MKKLQIGNVTLDNPIILAPMAGVSDLPFRLLCREMGAYPVTEFLCNAMHWVLHAVYFAI